eukprot:TRINITY_DN50570_c0_g1_i1.p1 TRINITY_DN50570_c0_g1~~TRINITY_DN50570_c0_g1_i1.p1  ORF type:complete len:295 (-),score=44.14 TRINITY_DN50570_c0_g1_i1:440-1255(-)
MALDRVQRFVSCLSDVRNDLDEVMHEHMRMEVDIAGISEKISGLVTWAICTCYVYGSAHLLSIWIWLLKEAPKSHSVTKVQFLAYAGLFFWIRLGFDIGHRHEQLLGDVRSRLARNVIGTYKEKQNVVSAIASSPLKLYEPPWLIRSLERSFLRYSAQTLTIGVGGLVAFSSRDSLRGVLEKLTLERLTGLRGVPTAQALTFLLEPRRGRRSESQMLQSSGKPCESNRASQVDWLTAKPVPFLFISAARYARRSRKGKRISPHFPLQQHLK